jgi:hypothetical protein
MWDNHTMSRGADITQADLGRRWDGVVAALLYPARPASAEVCAKIEAVAGDQAVQVTWYDDVNWRP